MDIVLVNDSMAPVNVIVELTQTVNTGFSPAVIGSKFPHQIGPKQSRKITTAVPLKVGKPASFGYRLRYGLR